MSGTQGAIFRPPLILARHRQEERTDERQGNRNEDDFDKRPTRRQRIVIGVNESGFSEHRIGLVSWNSEIILAVTGYRRDSLERSADTP